MNYFIEAFTKKFADFDGRARRMEFWMFALCNAAVLIGIMVLVGIASAISPKLAILPMIVYLVYALASLVPGVAVAVRRLHDTGKSGLWLLIAFIPFGGIVLFVFYLMDSEPGRNQFGPNPKGDTRRPARRYVDDDDEYEDDDDDYEESPRRRGRDRDDDDDDLPRRRRR